MIFRKHLALVFSRKVNKYKKIVKKYIERFWKTSSDKCATAMTGSEECWQETDWNKLLLPIPDELFHM